MAKLTPREVGFRVAFREISEGKASFTEARERGLYPADLHARINWDLGYCECVCAWRLGHDVGGMIAIDFYAPSLSATHAVVEGLLDGTWDRPLRPDPRI